MKSNSRRRWAYGVAATALLALAAAWAFSCSQPKSTQTVAPAEARQCRTDYNVAFACGVQFLDVNGAVFPESQIVNACGVGDPIWGLSGAFVQCITDHPTDCVALSNCIVEAGGSEATPGGEQ
jgi:hypothetical protein